MNNNKKVFAFKLADKKEKETEKAAPAKWKAREGVSLAGCTEIRGTYDYREINQYGWDTGVWC